MDVPQPQDTTGLWRQAAQAGLSRRDFVRLLGIGGAAAVVVKSQLVV